MDFTEALEDFDGDFDKLFFEVLIDSVDSLIGSGSFFYGKGTYTFLVFGVGFLNSPSKF